jgi:hypothetical protein
MAPCWHVLRVPLAQRTPGRARCRKTQMVFTSLLVITTAGAVLAGGTSTWERYRCETKCEHDMYGLVPSPAAPNLRWVDGLPLLQGTGFSASVKAHAYDRLPAAAQHTTRGVVWSLSRDAAGLFLQFVSNASSLAVNVTYIYDEMTMWHFPSTGVAGLDLYAFDEGNTSWRWLATTNPSEARAGVPHVSPLATAYRYGGAAPVRYRLHLPLYNGVASVAVGYGGEGATLRPDPALLGAQPKPVVWYGTSIAQGGVASRPGMAFTNILSRRLGRPVLNFGFSGSCLMEPGVAEWLTRIDAAAFVIDCSWNMDAALIANRTVPLVRQLRAAAPASPILLAEDTEDGSAWASPAARQRQAAKRAALAAAYASLVSSPQAPDRHLHYVRGPQLFRLPPRIGGVQRTAISPTVGGCHPSDLGMLAIADFYSSYLPPLLGGEVKTAPPASTGVGRVVEEPPPLLQQAAQAGAATAEEARLHAVALASLQTDGLLNTSGPSAAAKVVWMGVGGEGGLGLMGRAFQQTRKGEYFDRLPAAARGVVREAVWNLSRDATGMFVPFLAPNASEVRLNYSLDAAAAPLWHMPASGTAGADLFRYDEASACYRFVGALHRFPTAPNTPFAAPLASGLDPAGSDRFLLFLPLRSHVVEASVGVAGPEGVALRRDEAFAADGMTMHGKQPVVWYGTSIDQGGVASRPGATYTSVLTRSLGRMVLNFGLYADLSRSNPQLADCRLICYSHVHVPTYTSGDSAGNGHDELSVAEFLVQLPAALFVIDCLPNLTPEQVSERTAPLVRYLRAHGHTETPIVLAAGTTYGDHWVEPGQNDKKRAALEAEYAKLQADGVPNLHLVANRDDALFAYDELTNPTVGGTHPTDLGHREIAAFYEQYLPPLLRKGVP